MLLLIAIHFHSGQLAAVGELVCATLGMRVPVRPNGLARIKQAFTQEIFTEQVKMYIITLKTYLIIKSISNYLNFTLNFRLLPHTQLKYQLQRILIAIYLDIYLFIVFINY